MKSTAPIMVCAALSAVLALGAAGWGFGSGHLLEARNAVLAANDYSKEAFVGFDGIGDAVVSGIDKSKQVVAIDMDSIPDNLTTDAEQGSEPLRVAGSSGEEYTVTDAEGNAVYVKESADESTGDIDKSALYVRYVVKRGDTLSRLSSEFGSSVDTMVRLNNINNPNLIYTDEVLHIPSNPPVLVSEDGEVSEP